MSKNVDVNKMDIIDLHINYGLLYEMNCLWEELILESGSLGPWSLHFETSCFNCCYT